MLGLIVLLVFIGIGLWLINTKIPMDSTIKTIVNVVVILFVLLILLQAFGLLGSGLWHGQQVIGVR